MSFSLFCSFISVYLVSLSACTFPVPLYCVCVYDVDDKLCATSFNSRKVTNRFSNEPNDLAHLTLDISASILPSTYIHQYSEKTRYVDQLVCL